MTAIIPYSAVFIKVMNTYMNYKFAEYYSNHLSSRLEISKTRSRPPPKLAYAQTLVPAVFRFVNRF